MSKTTRTLVRNFLLGVVTSVLLIGFSTPSLAIAPNRLLQAIQPQVSPAQSQLTINQHLMTDLQDAESVLTAQGMMSQPMQRYAAILVKDTVVPMAPSTSATGVAGAVLVGDRLVIRGDFGRLSSPLRDYAVDPVNPPNPNITSAVHIHQGESAENGPFQYALTVMLSETGMDGRFAGDYTLTSEQLQALADGRLYVDIHTQRNRAGELRGMFRPV